MDSASIPVMDIPQSGKEGFDECSNRRDSGDDRHQV
jgi:hypothetical protein